MSADERTRSMAERPIAGETRLRVVVFCGDIATYPIPRHGRIVLGRGEGADIPIEHVTVSRKHATILVGDDIRIVDEGSFNGTRIGGKRLAPHVPTVLGIATIAELGETMVVVQVDGSEEVMRSRNLSSMRPPPSSGDGPMDHVYRLVDNVAESNITVLVRGETGAGKEVVAERIHAASARAAGPLIKLNCAALPEQLLESELFGYERGAFTGATAAKPGLVESAQGGTLFLDEVGELPLATQAKLLRVVESREVMRIGSLRPKSIDVRLVAATHRDLEAMIAAGTFRQDLYYRINGVSVTVPPLRERTAEIPRLAQEFVQRFCREAKRPSLPISDAALAVLKSHAWPGNVRELRNVVERAIVFCKTVAIAPEHLGIAAPKATVPPPPSEPRAFAITAAPDTPPISPATPWAGPTARAWDAAPAQTASLPLGASAPSPAPPPAGYATPVPLAPIASSPPPYAPTMMSPQALTPPPVLPTMMSRQAPLPAASPSMAPSTPPPPARGSWGTLAFGSVSLPDAVGAFERERILQALAHCDGNQTRAAAYLGISRRTLLRRLDEFALPRPRK